MKRFSNIAFTDLLAWLTLLFIFLWLVLKISGIINTLEWLQYSPLFGAVYLAGWAMHKLERTTRDVNDISKGLRSVERRLRIIEVDLGSLRRKYSL